MISGILLIIVSGLLIWKFIFWKYLNQQETQDKLYDMLSSHRSYGKQLHIKAFYTTRNGIVKMYKPNSFRDPSHEKRTDSEPLYLVIQVNNVGDVRARGVLSCQTSSCGSCEVQVVSIRPEDGVMNYIIPSCYSSKFPPPSQPQVKWKKVYTRK